MLIIFFLYNFFSLTCAELVTPASLRSLMINSAHHISDRPDFLYPQWIRKESGSGLLYQVCRDFCGLAHCFSGLNCNIICARAYGSKVCTYLIIVINRGAWMTCRLYPRPGANSPRGFATVSAAAHHITIISYLGGQTSFDVLESDPAGQFIVI